MNKVILGIDISEKQLRYVCLKKAGQSLEVLKVGKVEHVIDVLHNGSLAKAIDAISATEGIIPMRIFVTLSIKDTIVLQMPIPKMTNEQMHEAIVSEIEKIPTMANVDFDFVHRQYQISADKSRVVVAALQEQFLDYVRKEIKATRIPCSCIDVSPLNLKEAASISTDHLSHKAIMVAHDNVTHLIIFSKGQIKLIYKIPSGCLSLMNPDGAIQEVALLNWLGELRRVIKSFVVENNGAALEKLFVVWDSSIVLSLCDKIHDALNLPVEALSLEKIPGLKVRCAFADNPIYVLAVYGAMCSTFKKKVDFPQGHFYRNANVSGYLIKVGLSYAAFVVALAVVAIVVSLNLVNQRNYFTKQKEATVTEITFLKKEEQKLFQLESDYKRVRDALLMQATYVQALNRVSWSQVFFEVSQELPQNLALTRFSFGESKQARIEGEAIEMGVVSDLIRKVENSVILEKGKFDFLRSKEQKETKYFAFGIYAGLKGEQKEEQKEKQ